MRKLTFALLFAASAFIANAQTQAPAKAGTPFEKGKKEHSCKPGDACCKKGEKAGKACCAAKNKAASNTAKPAATAAKKAK